MKVTLVRSDLDWEGLYIDGRSVLQNHSISLKDALEVVASFGQPFTFEDIYADESVGDNGHYPTDLSDVVR